MLVIGLTGNFGTGKTTVSQILTGLGAAVINADHLGHEALLAHSPTYNEVVAAFGNTILKPDLEIDRQRLGQIVFASATALTRLNRIMHPKMYQVAQERIQENRRQGIKVTVLEAALLIEANWTPLVDQIWATTAPDNIVLDRLKSQRGTSEKEFLARIQSQMPSEQKLKKADVTINTDYPLPELKARVASLWHGLQSQI